jgi:hypothetical protein
VFSFNSPLSSNDPPSPRVFPALAFVDNRLLVVGGRTQIEGNYTILKDAHMFTFTDDDQYSSGFWATIEIEGVDLWPKCTPTFAQAGNNTLYMVSQATEKTHVLLDNDLLSKLYNTKQADIHFELVSLLHRSNTNLSAFSALRSRTSSTLFGSLEGRTTARQPSIQFEQWTLSA